MSEKKKEGQEIELDKSAVEAIANTVIKGITPTLDEKIKNAVSEKEQKAEALVEKTEAIIKKNVEGYLANVNVLTGKGKPEKESVALRTVKACRAFLQHDQATLRKYNEFALSKINKEVGYHNKGVSADGGYIVLDPDFEAQVEAIMPAYGVMLPEVTVIQNESGRVKTNKRGSNVTIYETSEGASITASKMSITQQEGTLRKFAGLAVNANELEEDEAVDWYSELVNGFAEEKARLIDTMILTDTNATYPGILRASNTVAETIGALISSLSWDDLLNAKFRVPSAASKSGIYVMHRTVWNILLQTKSSSDSHYMLPTPQMAGQQVTPWGDRVVLADVMPDSAVIGDSNEPFIVYGNFKKCRLYQKGGYVIDQSKDATVIDQASATKNLFQMDMNALRVKFRALVLHKFPEQFCVIGTGAVS